MNNIAEILNSCPKGTKLYSPVCGECELIYVNDYVIEVKSSNEDRLIFYDNGHLLRGGEILLFPSEKQRDWNKFQIPFKFGDIVAMYNSAFHGTNIGIYNYQNDHQINVICTNTLDDNKITVGDINWTKSEVRHATTEEKEVFLKLLETQGYEWTNNKLKLKCKFKIGDVITNNSIIGEITEINNNFVKLVDINSKKLIHTFSISEQKYWELTKFDINTLVPFESKVLVRDIYSQIWKPAIYGGKYFSWYMVIGGSFYCQCIPYEGNEHLCGTDNGCDEYYKI